jgi:hypothetical protein
LTLFQIFSEAEGAEDRTYDFKDKKSNELRPEGSDSI